MIESCIDLGQVCRAFTVVSDCGESLPQTIDEEVHFLCTTFFQRFHVSLPVMDQVDSIRINPALNIHAVHDFRFV